MSKFNVQIEVSVLMHVEVTADSLEAAIELGRSIGPTDYLRLRRQRDELIDMEVKSVDGVFSLD